MHDAVVYRHRHGGRELIIRAAGKVELGGTVGGEGGTLATQPVDRQAGSTVSVKDPRGRACDCETVVCECLNKTA